MGSSATRPQLHKSDQVISSPIYHKAEYESMAFQGSSYFNEIYRYDPDDVIEDSPVLKPVRPILVPTPSPPSFYDDEPINFYGDGQEEESWIFGLPKNAKDDSENEDLIPIDTASDEIGPIMTLLKPSQNPNRFTLPSIASHEELASIQEAPPKSSQTRTSITLPSITAQLGHLMPLAATATTNKDPNGENRPSISHSPPFPPLFSVTQGTQQGRQSFPPVSPNDNFRRELPPPGQSSVAAASPFYWNPPSKTFEGPFCISSSPETPSNDQSGWTPAGLPATQIGGYQCRYPGCSAQPFQTQYLLDSHADSHLNRPHYCPVRGCPRGEGGRGFKRKNEMIRHGLIHESPGYVCPYCIDRERKYPRPDNLQRLVPQS